MYRYILQGKLKMERLCELCRTGTTAEVLDYLSQEPINNNYRDGSGNSPVYHACFQDIPLLLEALINKGFQLHSITNEGESALHISAEKGCKDVVDFLISRFPNLLTTLSARGMTPVHSAVKGGSEDTFRRLLAANLDPRATCADGRNIIHIVCEAPNMYSMFQFLISNYADLLHSKALRNWSIMHFTASGGNIKIMDYLVRNGFNALQGSTDDATPLHFACSRGNLEMVNYLLSVNSDQLQLADIQGYQAIHHAAHSGNIEILETLHEEGADIEKQTKNGCTILHIAAVRSETAMVKHIVDNYPQLLTTLDSLGRSALFTAAEGGSVDVMKYLFQRGLDPLDLDSRGSSVLHVACVKGNADLVDYLLSMHLNLITFIDEKGCMPIHSAVESGNIELFDKMCDSLAQPDPKMEFGNGMTILHLACAKAKLAKMAQHIICKFPELVNKHEGTTHCMPCHYVAKFQDLETFKLLEAHRANMFSKSAHGNTVLHLACETGNIPTVEYIMTKYPTLFQEINHKGQMALDFARLSKNAELVHLMHTKNSLKFKQDIARSNILVICIVILAFAWSFYCMD